MLTDVGESISSVTILNIVNQLDKHDSCCGAVKNNFSNKTNRNPFDPVLTRYGWNCSTT